MDSDAAYSPSSKSLEDKLFKEPDIAEEQPLPKHGKSKPSRASDKSAVSSRRPEDALQKRQLGEIGEEPIVSYTKSTTSDQATKKSSSIDKVDDNSIARAPSSGNSIPEGTPEGDGTEEELVPSSISSSTKNISQQSTAEANSTQVNSPSSTPAIMNHDEYVIHRVQNERLPKGISKVTSGRYLLRSVHGMHCNVREMLTYEQS